MKLKSLCLHVVDEVYCIYTKIDISPNFNLCWKSVFVFGLPCELHWIRFVCKTFYFLNSKQLQQKLYFSNLILPTALLSVLPLLCYVNLEI